MYRIDRRHRWLVQDQLRQAFPTWTPERIQTVAQQCYQNIGRSGAEFIKLGWMSRQAILDLVTVEGEEHVRAAARKGRGIIFLTAHLGNWELLAIVYALLGYTLFPVVRPLDNPLVNWLVVTIRSRHGSQIVSKKSESAARDVIAALRAGNAIGILLDQHRGPPDGIFVNFFGRPACTSKGLALIERRTGAPVLPAFIVRERDGRHVVHVKPPVEMVRSRDLDHDVYMNTARCTAAIEECIRAYPEQWLWQHRRWKTQPTPDDRVAEASPLFETGAMRP